MVSSGMLKGSEGSLIGTILTIEKTPFRVTGNQDLPGTWITSRTARGLAVMAGHKYTYQR